MKNKFKKVILMLTLMAMLFSLASLGVLAEEITENEQSIDDEALLMAIEPDTAYAVAEGTTKIFKNISAVELTVEISGCVDYVVYYKDNSIKTYQECEYPWEVIVPAGGSVVVTAIEDVECWVADDYFLVEEYETSVFNTTVINERETYSFTNTTAAPKTLFVSGNNVDYVVYRADGSVLEQERDSWIYEKEIAANNTIKITSKYYETKVSPLQDCFSVKKEDKKVFNTIIFSVGETYSFTNTGDIPYSLLTSGNWFDYVIYDVKGNIAEYSREEWFYNKEIPAGHKIKITARDSYLEICGLSEIFTVEKEDVKAYQKVIIPAGETFAFTNTSDVSYNLLANGSGCDYVIYDGDGNVTEYVSDAWFYEIKISSKSKIEITAKYSTFDAWALYEVFSVEKSEKQVFDKMLIPFGETYSFTNTGDDAKKLISNSESIDYVIYDKDGNVTEYVRDTYLYEKEIPAGGKIKITSNTSDSEIIGLSGDFSLKKEASQVFKKRMLSNGETYSFTNISDNAYCILSVSADIDYVIYDENGNVTEYERDVWFYEKEIPAGSKIKITSRSSYAEFCALTEYFNAEKCVEQVFKTVVIPQGEQYKFINNSSESYKILTDYNYGNCVIYNSKGNATSAQTNAYIYGTDIPSGYSMLVTAVDTDIECSVLNEAFNVLHIDKTGLYTELIAGKTYTITNLNEYDYELFWDNPICVFDYVVYGEEDTLYDYSITYPYGSIYIPSGGKAIITVKNNCLIGNTDTLIVSECDTPVYDAVEILNGETYLFENVTLTEMYLLSSNGIYDYIIYNKDGSINTSETGQTISYLTIPAGNKIAVTSKYYVETIYVLKDKFKVTKSETGTIETKSLRAGQTVKIKNTSKRNSNVYIRGDQYHYVAYNADGSINSYEYNYSYGGHELAPDGYIVVTACKPLNIESLTETFAISDVDDVIVNYNWVDLGETVLIKNVSAHNYRMFIISDYYDYVEYDGAGTIKNSAMENVGSLIEIPSGNSVAVTSITGKFAVLTLNGIFEATDRNYPALVRKTVYEDENYVFTNVYDEMCVLENSGGKLDYAIYTETDSVIEASSDAHVDYMEVPAGGRAEVRVKYPNVLFAGPYEAFSGEDLTVKVSGIVLSDTKLTLLKGKQALLTATVVPEDATNKAIVWKSSDTSVVTVAQTGKITAKGKGTAVITATTEDGGFNAECVVTVTEEEEPEEVVFIKLEDIDDLTVGEIFVIKGTTNLEHVIVVVIKDNESQYIMPHTSEELAEGIEIPCGAGWKAGDTITVIANAADVEASTSFNVIAPEKPDDDKVDVTGITLDKYELAVNVGDSETLTATVVPENATNKTVGWSSSDTSVATVENGVVTAVGSGEAIITATAEGKSTTCKVVVSEEQKDYTVTSLDCKVKNGRIYAEAVITKNTVRDAVDTIMIAVYKNDILVDNIYMCSEFAKGQSVTFGGFLDNADGVTVKAFVWDGVSMLNPLSNVLEK